MFYVVSRTSYERLRDAINGHFTAVATTSEGIDDFVPGDRSNPGRQRRAPYPGTPFQVQGQEDLLHNIFDIDPDPVRTTTNDSPEPNCERRQQLLVGASIPLKRLLHQCRPVTLTLSRIHSPSVLLFEAAVRFVTELPIETDRRMGRFIAAPTL